MVLMRREPVMMKLRLGELLRLSLQGKGGHPRNLTVGCQNLYGSNKYWKERDGYHRHLLLETAMYRAKQLLGGRLSSRNYNAQAGKTYAMIKALSKLSGLGMPETCRID